MRTLCEHPAWNNGRRLVRTANGVSLASATAAGIELSMPGPALDVYDPADLSDRAPEPMRRGLKASGPVARLRTPDLWDAIATAIIRQVIRANQARLMYQRFTSTYGEPAEAGHVFPSPEVVLALADEAFTGLGMAFKRDPLRAAAQAVLDHGEKWEQVPPPTSSGNSSPFPGSAPGLPARPSPTSPATSPSTPTATWPCASTPGRPSPTSTFPTRKPHSRRAGPPTAIPPTSCPF